MEHIWNLSFADYWHLKLASAAVSVPLIVIVAAIRARKRSVAAFLQERKNRNVS